MGSLVKLGVARKYAVVITDQYTNVAMLAFAPMEQLEAEKLKKRLEDGDDSACAGLDDILIRSGCERTQFDPKCDGVWVVPLYEMPS